MFQKMIASKVNDHEGFYLLQCLINNYPLQELSQHMRQIFSLLFQRLSSTKTTKFVTNLIVFFCFYAGKIGGTDLVQLIDGIQNNMFGMVCQRVFVTDMNKVSGAVDRKTVAIGISKLLCETPKMLEQPLAGNWTPLLQV